jgi:hypothetical protein
MTNQDFPLAWRWTRPSHSVLPIEVLAGIRPLSPPEAARVWAEFKPQGSAVVSCFTSDPADVDGWLRSVQPDRHLSILVCWSPDLVVQTTWNVFAEYWSDFCYPSSDDVMDAPIAGAWRLIYHHDERFDFITLS